MFPFLNNGNNGKNPDLTLEDIEEQLGRLLKLKQQLMDKTYRKYYVLDREQPNGVRALELCENVAAYGEFDALVDRYGRTYPAKGWVYASPQEAIQDAIDSNKEEIQTAEETIKECLEDLEYLSGLRNYWNNSQGA